MSSSLTIPDRSHKIIIYIDLARAESEALDNILFVQTKYEIVECEAAKATPENGEKQK